MLTLTGAGGSGSGIPAPTGLVFSNVTTSSLTLSWNAVTGADAYSVRQRLTRGWWGSAGIILTDFGEFHELAKCSAVQADGKIVIAGPTANDVNLWGVKRFNVNGIVDTSFGTNGVLIIDWGEASGVYAMAIQSDQKIVVVGGATATFHVARITTAGALDTSFNTTGKLIQAVADGNATATAVAIQTNGKIVVGGVATVTADGPQSDFALIRVNTNGTLDTTFGTSGITTTKIGTYATINSIALQSSGKIIAGGFSTLSGVNWFTIARYTTAGALDTSTFGTSGITSVNFESTPSATDLYSIVIQTDDKIVAVGDATLLGNEVIGIARLTAAGALDTTFNTTGKQTLQYSTSNDTEGNAAALQSDGKIVIAGTTATDSPTDNYFSFLVTRVNTDGSLDTSFGTSGFAVVQVGGKTGGAYDTANSVNVQADGKIFVAGESDTNAGSLAGTMRLTSSGSLDSSGVGPWSIIGTPASNTINESGLVQDESYDKQVAAHGGSGLGPYSSTATVVTLPGAPASMAASGVTPTNITVSWAQNPADGSQSVTYVLERRIHNVNPYVQVYAGSTASFPDTGVTQGHTYDYRSAEVNAGGQGAYSSVLTQATKNPPGKARNVKGNPGHTKIFVNFEGASSGGVPTTADVTATVHPNGAQTTVSGAPLVLNADGLTYTVEVDTLTDGTGYDTTVVLNNPDGSGPVSDLTVDSTNIIPFGFTPGAELFLTIDADHVTTSGAITSFNDQSGNGRDIPYVSGAKASISTGYINGKDGILFSSGLYQYTHNDSFSGCECFCSFVPPGISTIFGTTNLNLQPQNSGAALINSTASVSGYRLYGVNFDSSFLDGSRGSGHQAGHYRNGDTSTLVDANSGVTFPYTNAYTSIGTDSGSFSLAGGYIRKLYLCSSNNSAGNRQNYEGLLAWDIPFGHYKLPSGHPYYAVNSNGVVTTPATPTILSVVVGDATAIISHLPADEGNATPTYYCTSSVGGVSGNAANPTVTVTGLTNGSPQTFTTIAQNSAGSTSTSAASFSVTPTSGSTHLTGLVAEFQFTEPASTWMFYDASGNGHQVGPVAGPGTTTATNHNVRTFNGTTQWGISQDSAIKLLNTDFSFLAHFYPTDDNYGTIWAVRDGGASISIMLRRDPAGDLYVFIGGTESFKIGTALAKNTWHKCAVSFNKTTKALNAYVDAGTLQTHTYSNAPTTDYLFSIGGAAGEPFTGRLSLLTLWNVEKTTTELQNELAYWAP